MCSESKMIRKRYLSVTECNGELLIIQAIEPNKFRVTGMGYNGEIFTGCEKVIWIPFNTLIKKKCKDDLSSTVLVNAETFICHKNTEGRVYGTARNGFTAELTINGESYKKTFYDYSDAIVYFLYMAEGDGKLPKDVQEDFRKKERR